MPSNNSVFLVQKCEALLDGMHGFFMSVFKQLPLPQRQLYFLFLFCERMNESLQLATLFAKAAFKTTHVLAFFLNPLFLQTRLFQLSKPFFCLPHFVFQLRNNTQFDKSFFLINFLTLEYHFSNIAIHLCIMTCSYLKSLDSLKSK